MNVYVLSEQYYESAIAIYSTRDGAERAARELFRLDESCVREYEVDNFFGQPDGKTPWVVSMREDGSLVRDVHPGGPPRMSAPIGFFGDGVEQSTFLYGVTWATDRDDAVRIFDEKRRKILAAGPWQQFGGYQLDEWDRVQPRI